MKNFLMGLTMGYTIGLLIAPARGTMTRSRLGQRAEYVREGGGVGIEGPVDRVYEETFDGRHFGEAAIESLPPLPQRAPRRA